MCVEGAVGDKHMEVDVQLQVPDAELGHSDVSLERVGQPTDARRCELTSRVFLDVSDPLLARLTSPWMERAQISGREVLTSYSRH